MRTLAALCIAVVLSGCMGATIKTEVGRDEYGNPYFSQEISGKGEVVIKAAEMSFDGVARIDPETGALVLEIKSSQVAQGVQSGGLDLKTLAEIMKMVKTP